MDGWAFTLDDFAALHAPKLAPHGVSRGALRSALWGQSYWLPKSKAIARGGIDAAVTEWGVEKVRGVERLWHFPSARLLLRCTCAHPLCAPTSIPSSSQWLSRTCFPTCGPCTTRSCCTPMQSALPRLSTRWVWAAR